MCVITTFNYPSVLKDLLCPLLSRAKLKEYRVPGLDFSKKQNYDEQFTECININITNLALQTS